MCLLYSFYAIVYNVYRLCVSSGYSHCYVLMDVYIIDVLCDILDRALSESAWTKLYLTVYVWFQISFMIC